LFLRGGVLTALDIQSKQERQIAPNVVDFAATNDGSMIALIRTVENATDLWTVKRDGSSLAQVTTNGNQRMEATPSWSPDGSALVFASSTARDHYPREWPAWGAWCAASEVRLWQSGQQSEATLAPGCDPAFGPDGKRIAYAARPTQQAQGLDTGGAPAAVNSIRLINRQGQNGWDFARANGQEAAAPNNGHVVYGPAWSSDGSQVVYHRFLGYQALVDIDITEIAAAFKGNGQPLATGAGWLLPARFSPDGSRVAIVENNYSDARGFGGYDNWSVEVISTSGSRSIQLPSHTLTAVGQRVDMLPRAQYAVWSPTGDTMAVQLPPNWKPNLSANEPLGVGDVPGELWLWQPGSAPQQRIAQNVDFASPLAWLPAAQ
jgi:Tol biopolymer transport system component